MLDYSPFHREVTPKSRLSFPYTFYNQMRIHLLSCAFNTLKMGPFLTILILLFLIRSHLMGQIRGTLARRSPSQMALRSISLTRRKLGGIARQTTRTIMLISMTGPSWEFPDDGCVRKILLGREKMNHLFSEWVTLPSGKDLSMGPALMLARMSEYSLCWTQLKSYMQ